MAVKWTTVLFGPLDCKSNAAVTRKPHERTPQISFRPVKRKPRLKPAKFFYAHRVCWLLRFEKLRCHIRSAMRNVLRPIVLFVALICIADGTPLSGTDLKNLLAAIRQNRTTQADFKEERVIRLMKKTVLISGKVWSQPPNKFRREVKGNSPSVTVRDARELWIYYPNFKSAERYPLGKDSPLDATVAAINSAPNL